MRLRKLASRAAHPVHYLTSDDKSPWNLDEALRYKCSVVEVYYLPKDSLKARNVVCCSLAGTYSI